MMLEAVLSQLRAKLKRQEHSVAMTKEHIATLERQLELPLHTPQEGKRKG